MNRLISKQDFIGRLEKEAHLFEDERADLNANWQRYAGIAESILPKIPPLGFFASAKTKREAYRDVSRQIHQACRQANLDRSGSDWVELLLEYSSKSYARAADAHLDRVADRIDPDREPVLLRYLTWPLFFILAGLGLVLANNNAFDDHAILGLYVFGWFVLAWLVNRRWG